MIVWAFGGQGHERPGEGRELLPILRSRMRPEHVRAIETGGPAWSRTELLQPLLVDLSTAAALGMPTPDLVLGHSLGELSATCAAHGWSRDVTLELARVRGQSMADVDGGLCAVPIGERHPGLVLALENPGHDVLAGPLGALRGRRLPVGGAWHTPRCAKPSWSAALASNDLAPLRCPMLLGDGSIHRGDVRPHLERQIAEVFRFRAVLDRLKSLDVDEVVVFPPGRLLASWLRAAGLSVRRIEHPSDLEVA